ncbi:hypothetical protein THRCLA_11411, partial [Thraustotheca clavata]
LSIEAFVSPFKPESTRHVKPAALRVPTKIHSSKIVGRKATWKPCKDFSIKKKIVDAYYTLRIHPKSLESMKVEQRQRFLELELDSIALNPSKTSFNFERNLLLEHEESFDVYRVSQKHCTFTYEKNVLLLIDTSKCGIRVNQKVVPSHHPRKLRAGDVIDLIKGLPTKVPLKYVVCLRLYERDTKLRFVAIPDRPLYAKQMDIVRIMYDVVFGASPLAGMDRHGKFHQIKPLAIENDYHIIQNSIYDAGIQTGMTSSIRVSVKPGVLEELQHLGTLECQVLHFIANGSSGNIYFEDNLALVHPIKYFAMIRDLGPRTCFRLVVVSYDYYEPLGTVFLVSLANFCLVEAFLELGVPHIIVLKKCSELVQKSLLSNLYSALAKRKSVEQAYRAATQACLAEFPDEGADKLLLLPEKTSHAEVLFEGEPLRKLRRRVTLRPLPLYHLFPPLCESFCSRNLDLFKVIFFHLKITKLISSKHNFITITGQAGIGNFINNKYIKLWQLLGKSVVAKALTRHLYLRRDWVVVISNPVRYCHVPTLLQSLSPKTSIWDHIYHASTTLEGTTSYIVLLSIVVITLIERMLTHTQTLNIICTARQTITKPCMLQRFPESKYKLGPLSPNDAAELMMYWIQRQESATTRKRLEALALDKSSQDIILREDFAALKLSSTSPRNLSTLAQHPALLAANGIPKDIVRLATTI